MSETVARQRPSVDLDDFERRLDAQTRHQHHAHEDDPLAELARIVGEQPDPYDDMFARQPVAAAQHDELRPSYEPHGRQEPSLGGPPPRFSADFASIEAGLRGAMGGSQPPAPGHHADPHAAYGYAPQTQYADPQYADPQYADPQYADPAYGAAPQSWAEPAAARGKTSRGGSRRPVYIMAATMAIGVLGIGATFAYKGAGSSPREIKTIMAASGPTKEQPPVDQAASADQDAGASQQASTKLVSREEQPVDLQQAVQDNAAAHVSPDASNVPVPASPGQAANPDDTALGGATPDGAASANVSPAYTEQGGFGVGMPTPKRVKSVSVMPDGRIVDAAASNPAADVPAAPPTKMSDRAGPVTGSPLLPYQSNKTSQTPKSANRATKTATPHRVAEAQPADETDAAPAPKPAKPAKKAKPVRVASAETGAADATENAAADEAKPAGNGSFAVQLAAPGSESDARSATSSLLKKYGGALHGRKLGFHRAESNGHTVYRVRVSSLSKDDATSLCSKLKADGGSCFVAKN